MAGNTGGPWGGGGKNGSGGGDDDNRGDDRASGGRRPSNDGPGIPEIDDLVNKGREQLRVLMGGGGDGKGRTGGGGGGGEGPQLTRGTVGLGRHSTRSVPKSVRLNCSWVNFLKLANPV